MNTSLLAAVLAVSPFVVMLPAQTVSGGPETDRRTSTVTVGEDGAPVLAAVSIAYGATAWREGFNDMLPQLRGNNYTQLGKGWWTTLDTVGALEIGGTRIEAGTYYLGLRVDQGGAFSLLLFETKQAMQKRLLPRSTPLYSGAVKADLAAPLTFAKDARKDIVAKLEIEITADKSDPTKGTLAMRWGKHEATAPVKFELGAVGAEAGGRK